MYKSMRWLAGLLTTALIAGACFGDEPKLADKFYKFEIVVQEVSGSKVLNSRTYTTIAPAPGKGEIRAGSKIPFAVDHDKTELIDVGVNIDVFNIAEIQDKLAFSVIAEVSSLAGAGNDSMRPTIRQNRWSSRLIIALRKPTVIFSSDNVDAKSQMQVQVTATPVP